VAAVKDHVCKKYAVLAHRLFFAPFHPNKYART
jgi:hypothetical protein